MMAAARRGSLRWLAVLVAALAVACGREAKLDSGPLDRMYLPTGIAVHDHRLIVASSNADLRYDDETGGSIIDFDVSNLDAVRIAGAENIRSFAGDLAIAEPDVCTSISDPLAIVATRGSNTLNVLRIFDAEPETLACERCGIPIAASFVDPLPVVAACGGGKNRAFVGYLRAASSEAWITEYDLASPTVSLRNARVGVGPVRALAYDTPRDRLYVVGLATGQPTPLRWVDLGGCVIGATGTGACTVGEATIPALPSNVELRSIALAHPFGTAPQRAFLTGRVYDPATAATAGGRTVDYGGLLIVVDLVENAFGVVDIELVNSFPIGRGAQDVRVFPPRTTATGDAKRDVVAALAVDDGELWIYDDDTGTLARFGRNAITGAPELGHQPFGLAVDPDVVGTARLYVGSFGESFVTPIDVPLDTPDKPVFAGGTQHKISEGTPTP